MLSPKRLVEKAKKGIPMMSFASSSSSTGLYTVDDTRSMVPLVFLKSPIFQELLKISEEEFGLPSDRPITMACTAVFMEYILSLLQRHVTGHVERALLASIEEIGAQLLR